MIDPLRRARGLMGLATFCGASWALVGLVLGAAVLLIDPASIDAGEEPYWMAWYFGRAGFVSGIISGLAIATFQGRRALSDLRMPRMALFGALGGAMLPWISAGPRPMLPFFVGLGAVTASGALALARRGERLSDDRADRGRPSATAEVTGPSDYLKAGLLTPAQAQRIDTIE